MSLLMEALRKAEQVKKKAAESDSPPTAATPLVAPGRDPDEPSAPQLSGKEILAIETSEEAGPSGEARVVLEGWEVQENDEDTTPPKEPAVTIPLPAGCPAVERITPSIAPLLAPSMEAAPAAEPLPAPTSVGIAGPDASGGSAATSRQSAQAVFLAKSRHKHQAFRRRLLGYGLLLGLGIFGAAAYLYLSSGNPPMQLQPVPVVANPPQGEAKKTQPSGAGTDAAPQMAAVSTVAAKNDSSNAGSEGADSRKNSVSLSPTLPPAGRQSSRPVAESTAVSTASASPAAADGPEAVHFEPEPLAVSGEEAAQPASIRISKRSAAPHNDSLLTTANGAFEQGRYEESRSGYQQILKAEPEHRGALLGLAALAVRAQDAALARDLYLRLLTQDPSDPLAKAGLLSVMAGGDPVRLESELKLLLEVHPDLAPLFFLLGNHYAAGRRWNEAQQAYFKAVQTDGKGGSRSPDYSFNLAVSLEHLGQPAVASRYYREALNLAEHRPAGFNREALERRLADLLPGGGQ